MPAASPSDDSGRLAEGLKNLFEDVGRVDIEGVAGDLGERLRAGLSVTRRSFDAVRADNELRELQHDRQDLEGAVLHRRRQVERYFEDDRRPYPAASDQHRGKTMAQVQAERDFGVGTTVEDAVARVEAELREDEERLEAVNGEIDLLVFDLWVEAYPSEPLPVVGGHRDLEDSTIERLLEELDESGGLTPIVDYPILVPGLGLFGLWRAVKAQRTRDIPELESILAEASTWDQQSRGDVYTVFGVRPGKSGTLRVVSQQVPNPQSAVYERGTRRSMGTFGMAPRRARARARSSRCAAPGRRQGSRRRTTAGKSSSDDPGGEGEPGDLGRRAPLSGTYQPQKVAA